MITIGGIKYPSPEWYKDNVLAKGRQAVNGVEVPISSIEGSFDPSSYANEKGYAKYFQKDGQWYANVGGTWQTADSKENAQSLYSNSQNSVTEQLTSAQNQLSDLQAQQQALTDYGLTDTEQLTQDETGGYVPLVGDTGYTTGNNDLDAILTSMQDILTSIIDSGQIVNPNIDITPEMTQQWLDQASAEIDPYYQNQFNAIRDDLNTDLTYLGNQYSQAIKANEASFKEALATQREAEAGAGTIFSGGRKLREQSLAGQAERNIEGLTSTLGYQAQKAGTEAERTIGSANLSNLSLSGYSPYSVSTSGQGGYNPIGNRNLFSPTGGVTGSLEREQIEKRRAYSDLLKSYWLEEQNV